MPLVSHSESGLAPIIAIAVLAIISSSVAVAVTLVQQPQIFQEKARITECSPPCGQGETCQQGSCVAKTTTTGTGTIGGTAGGSTGTTTTTTGGGGGCTPNCYGKPCGSSNGCGGTCTTGCVQQFHFTCQNNSCVQVSGAGTDTCSVGDPNACKAAPSVTCQNPAGNGGDTYCDGTRVKVCGSNGWTVRIDCGSSGKTCDPATKSCVTPTCIPNCTGKACGSDGCGGSCGTCPAGQACRTATGQCYASTCVSDCTGKACGDNDNCGGICQTGSCPSGQQCITGQCQEVRPAPTLTPTPTPCKCPSGADCPDGLYSHCPTAWCSAENFMRCSYACTPDSTGGSCNPPVCAEGKTECNASGGVNYCENGQWYSRVASPGECGKTPQTTIRPTVQQPVIQYTVPEQTTITTNTQEMRQKMQVLKNWCDANPAKCSQMMSERDRQLLAIGIATPAIATILAATAITSPILFNAGVGGGIVIVANQREAIFAGIEQSGAWNQYVPSLNKFVYQANGNLYDASTGELLGPISNFSNQFYLQNYQAQASAVGPFVPQYVTVTPTTFQSQTWKDLSTKLEAASPSDQPGVNLTAITQAIYDNVQYNPDVATALYAAATNPIESGIRNIALTGGLMNSALFANQTLENRIANNLSVCFDIATTEHVYLAERGIPTTITMAGKHVFLTAEINGQKNVIDPTANVIMPYDQYIENYGQLIYYNGGDVLQRTIMAPLVNPNQ